MEHSYSHEQEVFEVEEVSKRFDSVQSRCFQYEDQCSDEGLPTYLQTIAELNKIQLSIIHHSLFSINEEIEEVATENLKYLILPFYMGEVSSRIVADRKKNLEFSQLYLGEFLKLANHYGLVSKEVKKQWKNLSEESNYSITREEKIASFNESKALKLKLTNLTKIKEEQDQRQVVLTQMQICIFRSIDYLRANLQEVEILEYQELIKNDPKAKEQHEKAMNKPLPKPTMTKIAKPDEPKSVPFMLEQHKGKVSYLCGPCGQTKEEMRQELRQQVFTPGTTMATVSLEEFANIEMANMERQQESEKQAKLRAQKEEDEDSDRDSVGDPKQEKARRWDDWKDENEKGAGNRHGK